MMKECIKCGIKENQPKGVIWISEDGFCSVCNHKFKDRKRKVIGIDTFLK